jgi:hypothetical protein
MKRVTKFVICLSSYFLLLPVNHASAADLTNEEKVKGLVSHYADTLCEVPSAGSDSDVQFIASVGALLNRLKSVIGEIRADAQFKMGGKDWEGPVQKDIARLIIERNNCRLKVAQIIFERLPPEERTDKPGVVTATKPLAVYNLERMDDDAYTIWGLSLEIWPDNWLFHINTLQPACLPSHPNGGRARISVEYTTRDGRVGSVMLREFPHSKDNKEDLWSSIPAPFSGEPRRIAFLLGNKC